MSTISQSSSTTSKATPATDRASIAQNFDQFLMLLTAQLKNQNPMDPMNTNDFTQQLVSFASVEQQIKSNESLNTLMTSMNAQNAMSALNFVGKTVTASGTTTILKDGKASWALTSDKAGAATIKIKDTNGAVIRTLPITINGGTQNFTWDGTLADGSTAPAGKYAISVEGTDLQKTPLTIATAISGLVDKVDLTTAPPTLNIGSISVSLDAVKAVGST